MSCATVTMSVILLALLACLVAPACSQYVCSRGTLALENVSLGVDLTIPAASDCVVTVRNCSATCLRFADANLRNATIVVDGLMCPLPLAPAMACVVFDGNVTDSRTMEFRNVHVEVNSSTTTGELLSGNVSIFGVHFRHALMRMDHVRLERVTLRAHNVRSAASMTLAIAFFGGPLVDVAAVDFRETVLDATADSGGSCTCAIAWFADVVVGASSRLSLLRARLTASLSAKSDARAFVARFQRNVSRIATVVCADIRIIATLYGASTTCSVSHAEAAFASVDELRWSNIHQNATLSASGRAQSHIAAFDSNVTDVGILTWVDIRHTARVVGASSAMTSCAWFAGALGVDRDDAGTALSLSRLGLDINASSRAGYVQVDVLRVGVELANVQRLSVTDVVLDGAANARGSASITVANVPVLRGASNAELRWSHVNVTAVVVSTSGHATAAVFRGPLIFVRSAVWHASSMTATVTAADTAVAAIAGRAGHSRSRHHRFVDAAATQCYGARLDRDAACGGVSSRCVLRARPARSGSCANFGSNDHPLRKCF